MKKFLTGLVVIILVLGGLYLYDMSKQKEIKKLQIKNVDISTLADGTYNGEYNNYRWSNKVQITIEDKTIKRIKITEQAAKMPDVTDELLDRVVKAQSLKVDTITGATITSKSILKAMENALTK